MHALSRFDRWWRPREGSADKIRWSSSPRELLQESILSGWVRSFGGSTGLSPGFPKARCFTSSVIPSTRGIWIVFRVFPLHFCGSCRESSGAIDCRSCHPSCCSSRQRSLVSCVRNDGRQRQSAAHTACAAVRATGIRYQGDRYRRAVHEPYLPPQGAAAVHAHGAAGSC